MSLSEESEQPTHYHWKCENVSYYQHFSNPRYQELYDHYHYNGRKAYNPPEDHDYLFIVSTNSETNPYQNYYNNNFSKKVKTIIKTDCNCTDNKINRVEYKNLFSAKDYLRHLDKDLKKTFAKQKNEKLIAKYTLQDTKEHQKNYRKNERNYKAVNLDHGSLKYSENT